MQNNGPTLTGPNRTFMRISMLHCSFAKADLRQLASFSAMVEELFYWTTTDDAVRLSIIRITTQPSHKTVCGWNCDHANQND